MQYYLSEFFRVFFDAWSKIGTQDNFFELWNYLDTPQNLSYTRYEKVACGSIEYFNDSDLNSVLFSAKTSFEYQAPQHNGDDGARANVPRWCGHKGKPTTPKEEILLSFVAFLCVMFTDDSLFEDYSENNMSGAVLSYEQVPYLKNQVIAKLCEIFRFDHPAFLEQIAADSSCLMYFLLATLFVLREWQKKKGLTESELECSREKTVNWLIRMYHETKQMYSDQELSAFQKEYYETLWNACNKVYIRDIDDGNDSSISKNAQISKLYIVPSFLKEGIALECPVASDRRISQMVAANSGCGKSTFLQAIITTNIFEALCSWDLNLKSEVDFDAYKTLKSRLGFQKSFLPILIKPDAINNVSEDCLSEMSLRDLILGNSLSTFHANIEKLLQQYAEKGELLLLIDALDEIDGSNRKTIFGKKIDKFLSQYPSTNMIMTTRAIDLRDFYERQFYGTLERITIGLLGENEIYELIEKWTLCDGSFAKREDVEKKYKYIMANKYLSDLAQNPYILSHILWIRAHQPNATPQIIISGVINKLIEKRWPRYKYDALGVDSSFMRELLAYIAWEMVKNDMHYIPAGSLVSVLGNAAKAIDAQSGIDTRTWITVAREMNSRAGLLILEDIGYVFQSKLIERYLASEWLISQYVNAFGNEVHGEYEILDRIAQDFPDISNGYWSDVILMMFTPDQQYTLGKNDMITPALYRYLLLKSAETVDSQELCVIANILYGLVVESFGYNRITNKASAKGMQARKQIAHFLWNHEMLLECSDRWKESSEFGDALEFIVNNNVVNRKEV